MSSKNISIEDSLDISCEALSDKETQTSSTYITDSFDLVKGPSRPLPKGIDKTDTGTTANNLLDGKVIKDSSDSKSTKSETECFVKNIQNLNSDESVDEEVDYPTSLKYCKEVAVPYLKTHSNDCEDSIESLEKLVQDASDDIPDYQPCFEVYDGKRDIKDKINETTSFVMANIPNNTNMHTEDNEKSTPDSKNTSETIDDQSIPKSAPATTNVMKSEAHEVIITEEDNKTKHDKELRKNISLESINQCIKESLTTVKQSASACLEKIETMIENVKLGTTEEKPTYYEMDKPEEAVSLSQNVQTEIGNSFNNLKTLLNNEKIATFTDACKDFAEDLMNKNNEKISAMKETCKDFAENLMSTQNEKICAIKDTCKEYADNLINIKNEKISAMKDTYKDFTENLINTQNEKISAMKDTCKDFAENLISTENKEKICAMKDSCKDFAENLINTQNEKISAMKDTCKDFAENLVNTHGEKIIAIKNSYNKFTENVLKDPDVKINALKESCKDYADKLYSSSKEAVSLLSSESAKFFSKPEPDYGIKDEPEENPYSNPMRLNMSAHSITSFFFKKAENKSVNENDLKVKAITSTSRLPDAIPSTVKLGLKKLEEDIVSLKFDKSSKYDVVTPKESTPKKKSSEAERGLPTVNAIDNNPNPPAPSNVFEMIRSKIFSMFLDEGERSPEQTNQEPRDEEEDDAFENFVEQ